MYGGGGPARHDSAPAPPSQRVQRQTTDVQVVSSPRQVRFLGPRPCSVSSTRVTVAAPHGFGEETQWVQHPETVADVKDSVGPHARQVTYVPRSFSEDPVVINTRKLPLRQSARWPACTEKENPKPPNKRGAPAPGKQENKRQKHQRPARRATATNRQKQAQQES